MFPFLIRSRVRLGPRKDFHISITELQERIARRLILDRSREKRSIADGKPRAAGGVGLLSGGVSRLRNMGFLTTVKVRRIRIVEKGEWLVARFTLDATASTLMSVVVVPLVLGSALLSRTDLAPVLIAALLILLVLLTWGMDVYVLLTLVKHEIQATAAEVRSMALLRDLPRIDEVHAAMEPDTLLAIAYYYERNGHLERTLAYLEYLQMNNPESREADLAAVALDRIGKQLALAPQPSQRPLYGDRGVRGRFWQRQRQKTGHAADTGKRPGHSKVRRPLKKLGERLSGTRDRLKELAGKRTDPGRARQKRERLLRRTHHRKSTGTQLPESGRRRWWGRLWWRGRRDKTRSSSPQAVRRAADGNREPGAAPKWWQRQVWPSRAARKARQRERRWLEGPVRKERKPAGRHGRAEPGR